MTLRLHGSRYHKLKWLILLLSITLLGACSKDVPRLSHLTSDATLVAFGDSLTYGSGATAEDSYPAILENLIGRGVFNEGRPGELSGEGLQRLPGVLDEIQPQLLILCHGGNDMLRRKSSSQTLANLKAMVLEAHKRGIEVILIGVPEPALFLLESAPIYEQLADEMGLPFEGEALPRIESDRDLKSDQIHPNAQGYRQLAEAIAELLTHAGAI